MLFNATRVSNSPSATSTSSKANSSSVNTVSLPSTSIVEPSTSQLGEDSTTDEFTSTAPTSSEILSTSQFEATSSSIYGLSTTEISTSLLPTTSWSYASTLAKSSSISLPPDETVFVYTQNYVFTASSTTLCVGLPSMVVISTGQLSTYSAPTSAITTDISYYQHWLDGSLDSQNNSSSGGKRKTIIGSVVGSVGGFLLCALLLWLIVFKRRKDRGKGSQSFSHEIGCRLDHPSDLPEASNTIRSIDDEDFLRSKYKSLGKKIPLLRKGEQSRGLNDDNHDVTKEGEKSNPFQDEFNFQKRLPAPPPVPTRNPPLQSFYSYTSDTSSSSAESANDSFSIQLNRPNGDRRSQSFLKEII
ncbi:LAFE_0H03774g1_1 [Lachancea fermentati]|uniref:LAFE_0H03774g1_1 n=1 Tax=Lachancea fermentati TaxID=4955 RepID=A0A1G4MJD9_LACFM|nr:LAFE_0H03774g1_1 [Lachancea fermentati]